MSKRPTDAISPTLFAYALIVCLACLVGCANWRAADATSDADFPLQDAVHNDSVPLIEVSFIGVRALTDVESNDDSIWQWIDETRIDAVQRRRLTENGIRVGFVSNEDQFRQRLERENTDSDVLDDFLGQVAVKSELAHGIERLPLRYGRRHELPLRQPIEGTQVTMVRLENGLVGETLLRPQPILAITSARSRKFDTIDLQFQPELQYGEAKQRWISSESAFRIDTRRETWSLPELTLDVSVGTDDLLVITADRPAHGLGKQMLTGAGADQAAQQIMLLIDVIHPGRP